MYHKHATQSSKYLPKKNVLKSKHRYNFSALTSYSRKIHFHYVSNVTQKQTKSNNHISHTNYDFHLDDILQKIVFQKYQQSLNGWDFFFQPNVGTRCSLPHITLWCYAGINFKIKFINIFNERNKLIWTKGLKQMC